MDHSYVNHLTGEFPIQIAEEQLRVHHQSCWEDESSSQEQSSNFQQRQAHVHQEHSHCKEPLSIPSSHMNTGTMVMMTNDALYDKNYLTDDPGDGDEDVCMMEMDEILDNPLQDKIHPSINHHANSPFSPVSQQQGNFATLSPPTGSTSRRRSPCFGRHHHSIPSFHLLMEQQNRMSDIYVPSNSGSSNDILLQHHSSQSSPQTFSPSSDFDSSSPKPRMTMEEAIELKRYDVLHQNLSRQGHQQHYHSCNDSCDPNEEILFHKKRVYMTGLEYAVFQNDWKMAILFYIHAADPNYNCFDGRIIRHEHLQLGEGTGQTERHGDEGQGWGRHQAPPLLEAMRTRVTDNNDEDRDNNDESRPANAIHHIGRIRNDSNDDDDTYAHSQSSHAAILRHLSKTHDNRHIPIAGFEGLYKLLHSIHKFMNLDRDDCCEEFEYNRVEFNKTLSSLWLMEQSYSDRKVVYKHDSRIIERTRKALFDIGTGDIWRQEFCDMVYFLIQVMRRGGQGCRRQEYGHGCDYGYNHRYFNTYHCHQQYQVGYQFPHLTTSYQTNQIVTHRVAVDPTSSEDSTNRIPNEICLHIMEYLVDDLLSHTIWKALKHVSDSAATTNRNHCI